MWTEVPYSISGSLKTYSCAPSPQISLRSFLPYNQLKESSWVLSMDIQTWFYSLPLAPYAFRRNSEIISPSDLPTFLKNKVLLLEFPGTFNNLVNFQHLGDVQIISLVAQMVKNLSAMRDTCIWSLGREDPLEKEMATHSGILAWRIPRTEEPGELQSIGSQRL